jgi:hypothetical protein
MFNKNGIAMRTEDRFNTEDLSTIPALTQVAACAPQAKAEPRLSDVRRLILGVAMAIVAAAPARSALLFKPVGLPAEVFSYQSKTISKPLTDTNALSSPKLYFIFVGPNFGKDGDPSSYTTKMIEAAKTILGSSYLSGLTQYGSDGHALFSETDYTIDHDNGVDTTKNNFTTQMWDEVEKYLSDAKFSSWLPQPGGPIPIYVVVHYADAGASGTPSYNHYGTIKSLSLTVNAISVSVTSVDQTGVDNFSWGLSHELVERMYSGTGGFAEVSPSAGTGQQICDGEPEHGNGYDWRLGGSDGPLVTSYWSFVDQAYIIPDGNLDRNLLVPVWDSDKFTHKFVSLQQGTLYQLTSPDQRIPVDTKVQSFTVNLSGGVAQVAYLTADGQVKQYSVSDPATLSTLTGSRTVASALVSTSHLVETTTDVYNITDGTLYMLATDDNGPRKVWEYSGTSWTGVTGSEYTGISIAAANGALYMTANNFGTSGKVWKYDDKKSEWDAVTNSSVAVYSIVSVSDTLYMTAVGGGSPALPQVWRYKGSDSNWSAVTDADTMIYGIAAAGNTLCILSSTSYNILQVWEYGLKDSDWFALSDKHTQGYTNQLLVQDGGELFIAAADDKGIVQIWQYKALDDWTVVTPSDMYPQSASVGPDNRLYAVAYDNSGQHTWIYKGTPGDWSKVK